MEHQDWDTIYMKANHILETKDKDKPKKEQSIGNKETKMEQKIEEGNLKIKKTPAEMGKKIQKKRTEMNMTQKELAQKINQSAKIINEIESGKANHNPQRINQIKRILKLDDR